MTVYVDEPFVMTSQNPPAYAVGARNGHTWCHLFADDPDELRAFAAKIGLKAAWFQDDRHGGHFDLTPGKRRLAVLLGAVEVTRAQAVVIWRRSQTRWLLAEGRRNGLDDATIVTRLRARSPGVAAAVRRLIDAEATPIRGAATDAANETTRGEDHAS